MHKNTSLSLCVSVVLLLAASSAAYAKDSYRSKVGLDLKGFRSNTMSELGWIAGLRTARFIGTSQLHLGLAAYFGVPKATTPQNDHLYYGGATIGIDGQIGRTTRYEFNVLLGLGEGKINSVTPNVKETSYFVVEPSLAAGFQLGGGWRITTAVGYLHMSNARTFSGVTFGLRFTHRTQTRVSSIDN